MSANNYYVPGQWNAICDVCGFEFKSGQLRKDWRGLMVCKADFETRHPQDLLRLPREESVIPWSRPEPTDVFLSNGEPILTEDGLPLLTENEFVLLTET